MFLFLDESLTMARIKKRELGAPLRLETSSRAEGAGDNATRKSSRLSAAAGAPSIQGTCSVLQAYAGATEPFQSTAFWEYSGAYKYREPADLRYKEPRGLWWHEPRHGEVPCVSKIQSGRTVPQEGNSSLPELQ